MSKSIKRNNKYFAEEHEQYDYEDHRERLKEKRLRSALKSRNVNALFDLLEER